MYGDQQITWGRIPPTREERAKKFSELSLMNPATASVWWGNAGITAAGVNVDEDSAMSHTAVWAAVNAFCSAILQCPCEVYLDGFPEATHSLEPLLGVEPNPEMSAAVFFETLQGHYETYGNAFAEIEINGAGGPIALWPVAPWLVKRTRTEMGTPYYEVSTGIGRDVIPVATSRMIHFVGFSPDGMMGYSPVEQNSEAIGLSQAAERSGAKFFGRGMKTDIYFKHPGELSPEAHARLERSLADRSAGLDNHHRALILEEGLEVGELTKNPEQSQMSQTRLYQLREVARVWGLQPHRIGDLERATFSNVEQQSLEFVVLSLQARTVKHGQELTRKLLTRDEIRKGYRIGFDVSPLLQGGFLDTSRALSTLKLAGLITTNEARKRIRMRPLEGGDVLLQPANNMQPIGTEPNDETIKTGGTGTTDDAADAGESGDAIGGVDGASDS